MAQKQQKLELTWIGKGDEPTLEPRILIENPEYSYGDSDSENMLIHGDNLLALKALEQDYAGKVKCIYIDPPFNTGQAFEHYDDGLEHSIWLDLMKQRLEILQRLLHEEGTIFIHIDDNELGYLLAICDEIFGRKNKCFIATFKQGSATGHKAINPGCVNTSNYIITYCKEKSKWAPNKVYTKRKDRNTRYDNFVKNSDLGHQFWEIVTLKQAFAEANNVPVKSAKKLISNYDLKLDKFVNENAKSIVQIAYPNYDAVSKDARQMIDNSKSDPENIYHLERKGYSDFYLINGKRLLFYFDRFKDINGELTAAEPLTNLWDDLLSNNLHNEGQVSFPKGKKPEHLIKRVIELSTSKGDIVLDSFAGSGATAASAHKMSRKWITIELGEHYKTHVIPRMNRVIDNKDTSGISKAVNWQGGGGFKFYELAPSLLNKDQYDNWVISKEYNANMLAAAMAKQEGFSYSPNAENYWKQGFSSEQDFIYTTTQFVTVELLDQLHDQLQEGDSLLICAKKFQPECANRFGNISLKKIPQMLLGKCEFAKDDYSLNIINLPQEDDIHETEEDLENE